jgi:hypothetical protein
MDRSDEGLSRQCLQVVDLGFVESRGQVDLEDCQANKSIQLNKTRWLGFTMIRSSFRPQPPLYIEGEAEAFSVSYKYKFIGPNCAFPILIQVSYYNSTFLIRTPPAFWASNSSSPWALYINYELWIFTRHAPWT